MIASPRSAPADAPFPLGTPGRLLLCLCSVLFFRLGFPGGPLPFLAWVCLVPVSLAIHGLSPGRACLWALGSAALGWMASVWWITVGLTQWVRLSPSAAWTCASLFCLYAAIPYALGGGAWALCRQPYRPREALFASAFMTAAVSWFPQIFPGNPAHSLFDHPVPIQVLDLGGVPMLLFILILINRLVSGVIIGWTTRRGALACGFMLILTAGAVLAYGHARVRQIRDAEGRAESHMRLTVAAIQPNIPVPGLDHTAPEDRHNGLHTLFQLSEMASARSPETGLIVWPEIPVSVPCDRIRAEGRSVEELSRDMGRPIMTPCIHREKVEGGLTQYANMAVLIRPDGVVPHPYTKRILVPFSEYLPLEEEIPLLRRIFPGAARYEAGEDMVLVNPPGTDVRVIPTICYESIFTRHVREGVEAGGNLVVNMVDDAWFGPTAASTIHMALGVFRSVEYRIPLVRVTNSGDGVFVRASGEILPGTRTPSFRKATRIRTLPIPGVRSPYARWGDIVLWGLTILAAAGWLRRIADGRKAGAIR